MSEETPAYGVPVPAAEVLRVFVPVLPQRCLSSNAGTRSRRDPWSVANAKGELKGEVQEALNALQPLPRFERAHAAIVLQCTNRKPKLEQCARCLGRYLRGDHPGWAKPPDRCICYRPHDIGNIGGDVLKPVLDALVWCEVIPDDDRRHLAPLTLDIWPVEKLEDEGIVLTVYEVTE